MLRLFGFVLLASVASCQVLQMEHLNTEQIRSLDRNKTVIIIPGGILEEHGPYLPSYTDGYSDRAYSDELARSIVARPGWTAVLMPQIPLGSNPANDLGRKRNFPGSYTVRTATLRAVYMDLADALGGQGFRWIFVIHNHLGPANSLALNQAGDYFHDTYGGEMVHLLGLMPIAVAIFEEQKKILTPEQLHENGFAIHADASEHSDVLFLRPDLVDPGYTRARSITGATLDDIRRLAEAPDWPGYLGAPRFATPSQGARDYQVTFHLISEYAEKILDGFDYRSVKRYGDEAGMVPPYEGDQEKRQMMWLAAHRRP